MSITPQSLREIGKKYVQSILLNMQTRFSDDVGKIAAINLALRSKPEVVDFSRVGRVFNLSDVELICEWKILRRLSGDLSTVDNLIALCTKPEMRSLFPTFACLAQKILLLPIGTAGLERSFSTMNRILRSERCRLLPDHVDTLMKLSIEGPLIPDVRDGEVADETLSKFVDAAIDIWNTKIHRG